MQIEAVVFDWTGTIADFGGSAVVQTVVESFADLGIALSAQSVYDVPAEGDSRDYLAAVAELPEVAQAFEEKHGRAVSDDDLAQLCRLFDEKCGEKLSEKTELLPYVVQTAESLAEEGIKIIVGGDYSRAATDMLLAAAQEKGLTPDIFVCPEDVENFARPYPYMIFRAMQQLRISEVAAVIKVGDTRADIEEGIAAGVWTVAVLEGSAELGMSAADYAALDDDEKENLKETLSDNFWAYGADFVINDMSELFEVIHAIENADDWDDDDSDDEDDDFDDDDDEDFDDDDEDDDDD